MEGEKHAGGVEKQVPRAVFMAFGTKGDVLPVAAIASDFAKDQQHYNVTFITHAAHEVAWSWARPLRRFLGTPRQPDYVTFGPQKTAQRGKGGSHNPRPKSPYHWNLLNLKLCCERRDRGGAFLKQEGREGDHFQEKIVDQLRTTSLVRMEEGEAQVAQQPVKVQIPESKVVCWRDVMHWMWPLFTEHWTSWRTDCLHLSSCPLTDPVTGLPLSHDWPLSPQLFMGYIDNPEGMLLLLKAVLEASSYRIILFSAGHPPLDTAIQAFGGEHLATDKIHDASSNDHQGNLKLIKDGLLLFNNRLFCYAGSSSIPYSWLFPKCSVAIHHGGSGTTAAALRAGIPQIICPFMLDQYYWAERMGWIGVSPPPLKRKHLIPDNDTDSILEAVSALLDAIHVALSGEIIARAADLAERICSEDGVGNAINFLANEVCILADRM